MNALFPVGAALGANLTLPGVQAAASPSKGDFGAQLANAVREVNASQLQADEGLRALAAGESIDIHQTMIGLAEADITLRTMVSVRDRVVEAYQTVMNMSI